jgi:nucleoside-specific outer membrane channel protein Tsx
MKSVIRAASFLMLAAACAHAGAADWSSTAISVRHGDKFAEPFNSQDISKNIVALTHVSGYKYGVNFFNVDMLVSDSKDPAVGGKSGAQEAYIVYRHTLDFGKLSGTPIAFGPIKGVGATVGFDWNAKNDIGYSSRKRMLVAGPTIMLDVPGVWNWSVLALRESNAPNGIPRYTYKTHAMLATNWEIPLGALPLTFEGFGLYIDSKGKDEFGGQTGAETNIDMALMWDAGAAIGMPKGTLKLGLEYQYWKNKFGNVRAVAGPGSTAKTPMVRAAYYF